jgi:hypothetical protein
LLSYLLKNTCPLEIKAKSQFLQAFRSERLSNSGWIVGEEHQESTAAGADYFASGGSICASNVVPMIDARIADEL